MTLLIAVMIATAAVTIGWLTIRPKTDHATYLMCFLTGGITPSIIWHYDEWGLGWIGATIWIAKHRGGPPLE